jgi:hypothetical protein
VKTHPVERMTVAERNRHFERKDREFRKLEREINRRAVAARKSGKNHVMSKNFAICTRCHRTFDDLMDRELIECEAAS